MATKPLKNLPLIYSIDDDPAMNKLMEARFIKFGCEIKTFSDPKLLLDSIRSKVPKLLVTDLNLGEGLSGFDIIETIRFQLKLDFPIIVVSGESDSTQVAHAIEIGATDFVVKPPFRFQFEDKVAEYIQTANLPEHSLPTLHRIKPAYQAAKVTFQMSIQEVNPFGFTLLSTHLIKKGSSFRLSGEVIKKIIPSVESVFVSVLGTATQLTDEHRLYQIRVEVDPTQEQITRDIKTFLQSVRIETE